MAVDKIKNKLAAELSTNQRSKIKIIYPELKFKDLICASPKPYDTCLSCLWYLFIWPDGSLYTCVEWAGDAEFSIGNILQDELPELLYGGKRKQVLDRVNQQVIKERCAAVCAHHEMNIVLNQLHSMNGKQRSGFLVNTNQDVIVKHENFL